MLSIKTVLAMAAAAFLWMTASSCKKEFPCTGCDTTSAPNEPPAPRSGKSQPLARAGEDQVILLPTSTTALDGSLSIDADGKITAYRWAAIGGPAPALLSKENEIIAQVSSLKQGTYFFELTVTDNDSLSARDTVAVRVKPSVQVSCDNQTFLNATLVPFGNLSVARATLVGGAAGNKILFAAGWSSTSHSSRVDIYDTETKTWSTAELTIPQRDGMAVASVGSKVLFAGGGDNDWVDVTSRVDIYDAATNNWSTAELSVPRKYLAAATIGNKVYFGGGGFWGPLTPGSSQNYLVGSTAIDIYDNSTNTWSTSSLKEGRYELSATAVGQKIYFAGGLTSIFNGSKTVEILDASTGSWSYAELAEVKAGHEGAAVNDKVMWVAGKKAPYQAGATLSNMAETLDPSSGTSSFDCVTPKSMFRTATRDGNIVFFTGSSGGVTNQFDIYNTQTGKWSVGKLPFDIRGCAVVSHNNTIYIAGGWVNGQPSNQVWTLEF